jgi:hypothetical protein
MITPEYKAKLADARKQLDTMRDAGYLDPDAFGGMVTDTTRALRDTIEIIDRIAMAAAAVEV